MLILAIETSCDETSTAIYDSARGLLSNIVASQIDIHKKTGGVVPEVASRAHVEVILLVIDEALKLAKVSLKKINYIAVTHAPGLIGSLLVGVNTAKTLGVVLNKPVIPINHLEGHIYANFIREIPNPNDQCPIKSQVQNPKKLKTCLPAGRATIKLQANFKFPAVVLLVSGGHTSLILMKGHGKYKTLGETLDDAAGEAFDKVARVLELPYPGGPNISRVAEEYRQASPDHAKRDKSQISKIGDGRFFPRSMLDSGDFNFSFSGLKTAVLYAWQKNVGAGLAPARGRPQGSPLQEQKEMFAYEFEEAVVDILATKTIEAAKKYKAKTVSICGGVAANKRLREEIKNRVKKELKSVSFCVPEIKYCGDNAAMIACCASYKKVETRRGVSKNLDFEVMSNKGL